MAQYDGSIRINTKIDSKEASAQLMTLENRIVKTADKVASLRSKMDSLKGTKIPTQEYKDIESDIAKAEKELQKLIEKQAQMQSEGKDSGTAWDRLNQRIQASKDYIEYAKEEMQQLVNEGKAFTLGENSQEYKKLGEQLRYAENDLSALTQRHDELLEKQKNVKSGYEKVEKSARAAFSKVSSVITKAGLGIKKFGSFVRNAFSDLNKSANKSNGTFQSGLRSMLKYGLGIRSLYALVNKLRTAIKEGFTNMAGEIDGFKNSVNGLKADMLTLKNSFAAAFRPLVETAIPYIQAATNAMSDFLDKVGQFIAAATGQKTYTKAIKQTTKAIEDQNKAQNKQLSSLDKLNNWTSGSGSGAGESTEQMFEENVPVSGSFLDMFQGFKEMIEGQDWKRLGKLISEKINIVLKKLYNSLSWDKVKKKIEPFVNHVTETLNGLVSGVDFELLGSTVNTGLETVFGTLNTFIEVFDFEGLGKKVAQGIKAMFPNSGWWNRWSKWVGNKFKAVINTMKGFVDEMTKPDPKTGKTGWQQLGVAIGEGINTFIETVPWKTLGEAFSGAFNGIFSVIGSIAKTIDGQDIGKKVGEAIRAGLNGIDWKTVKSAVNEVAKDLAGFLNGLLTPDTMRSVGISIAEALNTAVGAVYTFFDELDPKEIGKSFGEGITGFAKTFDLGKLINTLTKAVNTIFEILVETVKAINWADALSSIWESLSNVDIGDVALTIGLLITFTYGVPLLVGTIGSVLAAAFSALLPAAGLVVAGVALTILIKDIIFGEDGNLERTPTEGNGFKEAMKKFTENQTNLLKSETEKKISKLRLDKTEGWETFSENTTKAHGVLGQKSGKNFASELKTTANEKMSEMDMSKWSGAKELKNTAGSYGFDLGQKAGDSTVTGINNKRRNIISTVTDIMKAAANVPITQFESTGKNAMGGVEKGMESKRNSIISTAASIAGSIASQFSKVLDIHSPSRVMKTMGEYVMEGFKQGMEKMYAPTLASIGGFGKKLTSSMSFGNAVFPANTLALPDIPGYATGQVIPRGMQEHLAILGDNKRETEIVSPLSTMKQAFKEAMAEMGGGNREGKIVLNVTANVDGRELFRFTQDYALDYFRRTGRSPYPV